MVRLAIDLQSQANNISIALPFVTIAFGALGYYYHGAFHIGTIFFGLSTLVNWYFKYVQKKHAILRNFGILGWTRYILESIGPELRQYFYLSDTEERPFNRKERSEVYQKAKNVDSTSSFGTLLEYDNTEMKIRHSMYPVSKKDVKQFKVTFGEERKCKNAYTINKPMMISAMSFGALGERAVRALSRGAKKAGIPINTGEGGFPKYHLKEGADLIFQMGTAKFGVRKGDTNELDDKKLKELAKKPQVKMIEIKFSQGAKPGKGGLLPKEKITKEISELRHVPMGKDCYSPESHTECTSPEKTVKFIKRVQDVSGLPVGIKLCIGNEKEFHNLVKEMKKQKTFPDYIAVDGAEGGTGAAPNSFMDYLGMPLFHGLYFVQDVLRKEKVRDKMKIVSSGKLINAGKQIAAMAHGADAIYSARGFMMALGCIQALQCNKGTCPVGITTHDKKLQKGLDIEEKSDRVKNYVNNVYKDFKELLAATGAKSANKLSCQHIYNPVKEEHVSHKE